MDKTVVYDQSYPSKKRTFKEAFLPNELAGKFRGKPDFIKYFKECCK